MRQCVHMRRALPLLIAVLLTFTSCKSEVIPVPIHTNEIKLVMQTDMSLTAQMSMQYFSYKVAQLSKNKLKVTLVESDNPIAQLGDAHFLFLPNDEIKKVSSVFAPFDAPFYFADYTHLTMTLNSERFWQLHGDMVKSLIEIKPMGAFYDGSAVLLSAFENMLDTLDQYENAKIYITENEMLEYTLKKFDAEVLMKDQTELIVGFNSGKYRNIECSTLLLENIKLPPKSNQIILSNTFHTASVNWLFLSTESAKAFSKEELAILSEAAAYALAQNDKAVVAVEANGFAAIRGLGSAQSKPNYSEFSEQTADILKQSAKFGNIWDWEEYDLVKNITNIQ